MRYNLFWVYFTSVCGLMNLLFVPGHISLAEHNVILNFMYLFRVWDTLSSIATYWHTPSRSSNVTVGSGDLSTTQSGCSVPNHTVLHRTVLTRTAWWKQAINAFLSVKCSVIALSSVWAPLSTVSILEVHDPFNNCFNTWVNVHWYKNWTSICSLLYVWCRHGVSEQDSVLLFIPL